MVNDAETWCLMLKTSRNPTRETAIESEVSRKGVCFLVKAFWTEGVRVYALIVQGSQVLICFVARCSLLVACRPTCDRSKYAREVQIIKIEYSLSTLSYGCALLLPN